MTERLNEDWLRGSVGSRQGIFPANYVEAATPAPTLNWGPPSAPQFVTAAYDYNSTVDGDLIFRAGELYIFLFPSFIKIAGILMCSSRCQDVTICRAQLFMAT